MDTKQVTIPAMEQHEGLYRCTVTVEWVCPVCGGPRGDVAPAHSYDGSRRMNVDGWLNACGHVDKYFAVRQEAVTNGLNEPRIVAHL